MPLIRTCILVFFTYLFLFNVQAQEPSGALRALESAFTSQKPEVLSPWLSPSFRVGVFEGEVTGRMVESIIRYYSKIEKIQPEGEREAETGQNLRITCFLKDSASFRSVIELNRNGKIERIRFFDSLYGCNVEDSSRLVARIPFEFSDSKIVIRLKINTSDHQIKWLFDTGADGGGIKKSIADEIGLKENRVQSTQVVGGSMQVAISERNTLVFDSLKIPNQNIAIFPDHNDALDGLFGSAFLTRYRTLIDFENSEISLFSFGETNLPEGYENMPLFYDGLPVLSAKVQLNSGKELDARLFFDTGASYSLILFGASVEKNELEEGFRVQSSGTTVSMGHSTPTLAGLFNSVEFGSNRIENFTGTLQTASQNERKFTESADGSLGIEIIRKFNWIVDLANRKFYFRPNRSFNDPLPFWLGNVFFKISGDTMRVSGLMPLQPGETSKLQTGDIIESMNDNPSVNYIRTNNQGQLEKIMQETGIEMVVSRGDSQFLITLPLK